MSGTKMYTGTGLLCFSVSDVKKSRHFYEAIGLTGWIHPNGLAGGVGRGRFGIYLMGFECKGDFVNFRGADAFAVHAHLQASGFETKDKPEHTTQPGTSWMTEDPDGHLIFFNTDENEITPARRRSYVLNHLRSLEWDLIDWRASEECLQALRQDVLARFGLESSKAAMRPYAGTPFLRFRVSDVERSVRFYEALGLTVTHREAQGATVRRGHFSIQLTAFDSVDCIHFRGVDPFELHAQLRKTGLEAQGEPQHSGSADEPGASWLTEDPEGHKVLFSTSESDFTPVARQTRVGELLRWTEQDLVDWDASGDVLQAYREHVLARFASS